MKRYNIKGLGLLMVFAIVIFSCSCNSGEKVADELTDKSASMPLSENNVQRNLNYEFPITDDLNQIGGYFTVMYGNIVRSIQMYRRVTGSFPESIPSYINSGFPLFWSRNVLDGSIVGYSSKTALIPGRDDDSHFIYSFHDSDHASFTFVYPTGKTDQETGAEIWREKTVNLVFVGQFDNDIPRDFGNVFEDVYSCPGSLNILTRITDEDLMWFLSECERLVQYVNMRTSGFYINNRTFPGDFSDMIMECNLFAKDNLLRFAQHMARDDVDFKMGYDYNSMTIYATLSIDGEDYIRYCHNFENQFENLDGLPRSEGRFDGCLMSELDMSSPMISSDNFTEFIQSIPPDVLIESKDIPIE